MIKLNLYLFEPKITVIIPNYNESRFIHRCLNSILNQEVMPDEIIIIDDASTDDSLIKIRNSLSNCKIAKIIENKKNIGVYASVVEGLKINSSDYVLFLSANDFLIPDIFKFAKKSLSKYPNVGLWSSLGWLVDEDDNLLCLLPQAVVSLNEKYFTPEDCYKLSWTFGSWFVGTSVIYRCSTLDEIGGFDKELGGLADLVAALSVACRQGAIFCPIPLAIFRIHSDSFLTKSLLNEEFFSKIINHFISNYSYKFPELFNSKFLERMKFRFIFAVINKSNGELITNCLNLTYGLRQFFLIFIDNFINKKYEFIRVSLSFLILRPFDIWVSLKNRFFGTLLISIRLKLNYYLLKIIQIRGIL